MKKRSFLKSLFTLGAGALTLPSALAQSTEKTSFSWRDLNPKSDDFWELIRRGYQLKEAYINLENGYYCFMPQELLEKYIGHVREVNLQGSYYLRTSYEQERRKIAKRLAKLADCEPDELVITRNTTESLDLVIGGFPWQQGDEAIMAEQDYGAMLDMFDLVAKRYGVVNKRVSLPNHPKSDEEIVRLYERQISSKTKLIMICHIVNITGQVLPVRKICEMAHSKGVEVMVDGAHSFAHVATSFKDLGCDYYGTSLHKWLSAPLGGGALIVKKDKIEKLWPLFAQHQTEQDDIYRLNHTGTRPVHSLLGIEDAIDFFEFLGAERKERRLRHIQQYWTTKVRKLPNIVLNTPEQEQRSCAIANVGVKGMEPAKLAKVLMDNYQIWTVAIKRPGVVGCRITPNIYTTESELDQLVDALTKISQ